MELPFWQLTAAIAAAAFLVVAAGALVRSSTPVIFVAIALLVAIPFAGFAAYAVVPGPTPEFGTRFSLVAVPVAVALGAGAWLVFGMTKRRATLTPAGLAPLAIATIVLWECVVLALSDVLAELQPAFAIANVAVNAAWSLAWVPRWTRRMRSDSSIEIGAPLSRVFEFVSEPTNWHRYDEDLVSVAALPPGPIAVGTEITTVRRFDSGVRGPRVLPGTIESRATVTEVAPLRSITSCDAARLGWSTIEFGELPNGTRITARARVTIPFPSAFLGAVLMLLWQRPARVARAKRNLARLKAILEAPVGAV